MRTRRYDGANTRLVLISMITDRQVCARITSQWEHGGLFGEQWANLVGGMVVKHFREYGSPPNGKMVNIFEDWVSKTASDEKTVDTIERFLQTLSSESENNEEPSAYVLDVAANIFNKRRIERDIEEAKMDVDQGRISDAGDKLRKTSKINLGTGSYHDMLSDPEIGIAAFDRDRQRPLVQYGGALGSLIGDSLTRSSLYAFMAPDKSGKSTWLIDLAYRALRNRNRVVFFDLGDSVKEEVTKRFYSRASNLPIFSGDLNIPVDWDGEVPKFESKHYECANDIEGFRALRQAGKNEHAFRLSCHPNRGTSVEDIDDILSDWEREGWRPDVIVLDYADLFSAPRGISDKLEKIESTWGQMRKLSQTRHALVVTATQANASAYGNREQLLGEWSFSGRKTKIADVNGMLGINLTSEERDAGTARINWIVRREGRYSKSAFVRVAGCHDFYRPDMVSKWGIWKKEEETEEDEE